MSLRNVSKNLKLYKKDQKIKKTLILKNIHFFKIFLRLKMIYLKKGYMKAQNYEERLKKLSRNGRDFFEFKFSGIF